MCSATNPQAEIYVPSACMAPEATVPGFWTAFAVAFVVTTVLIIAGKFFYRKLNGFMGTFSMF